MSYILFYVILTFPLGIIIVSDIRAIIFSILHGNRGKKPKKADAIRRNRSLKERISMTYMRPYIKQYRTQYERFLILYKVYIVYAIVTFVLFTIGSFFLSEQVLKVFAFSRFFVDVALSLYLGFHSDINHRTKYNRF